MNTRILLFLALAAWTVSVQSTIFSPCGLARTLYKLLKARQLQEIPLLVCIAGFQQFDTDYIAGYEARSKDEGIERSFHGIFGLKFTDMTKKFPEIYHRHEDRIRQDVEDFLTNVLHLDDTLNHPNYQFYKKICSKPRVRELSCRLNDYVLMNYKVYEPLNPGLLDEYRKMPYPTDNQPFFVDEDPDLLYKQVISETHYESSFSLPLLQFTAFWLIGSLFYVAARYAYDYLHFKFLRNLIAVG